MYLHAVRFGVVCLIGLLSGCGPSPTVQPKENPLERHEYRRLLMAVQARVVVYSATEEQAEEAVTAVWQRVAALEDVASDYRPASEVMRLCRKAGGPPVEVSQDLFTLLQRSCEISKASDGAFDVTIGPLVGLWREARKSKTLPPADQIEQAKKLVGWQKIHLDPQKRTAQLEVPGMKLDFGGIAKGYAGDCALAVLREHGIKSALFEFGGEVVMGEAPPGAPGWKVEILGSHENPKPHDIVVSNCAVSTSGDTEQFVVIDGKRYSHVVDPRTGVGLTSRNLATVIARDGILADGLSTAASVLGPEGSKKLSQAYPDVKIDVRTAPD